MLLLWHCSRKAALRITRGMWSRFPQHHGETEESSLRKKCFGCSDFYLIMFAVVKTVYFVQAVVLITSIACIKLQDGAGNSTMSYDAGELLSKIFNLNDATQSQSRNVFRFEDQNNLNTYNMYANEDTVEKPIYLSSVDDVNQHNVYNNHKLTYADDNHVSGGQKKRRRKQKYQRPQGFGPQHSGPQGPNMFQPGIRNLYFGSDFQGPIYRPTEPPRASFASETLSMVTEALTSMALYDDLQCVPRLLCEAASGGALGSSQTLQSITGLQPLLTLLSAYSGVSSNPLFVFGRAAFLGISSKDNPASCRYAYPLCPTDPEKLVYYLNNHNGGFFRFFNVPQRGPHNIGQFYDELSQNYENSQHVSPFPHNGANNNLYQHYQQNPNQAFNVQNYGLNYPYKQDKYGLLNNIRFKNNYDSNKTYRIEKRIQNRPGKYLDSSEELNFDDVHYQSTKWSFRETDNSITDDTYREGKGLKFPGYVNTENNVDTFKRDPRGFVFPESTTDYFSFKRYQTINPSTHKHNIYNDFYNNANIYKVQNPDEDKTVFPQSTTDYLNFNRYQTINTSPHKHNINNDFYNNPNIYKVQNPDEYTKDESIRTVYVVRGNGDPRRPEIVKLGPGQSVH